MSPRLRRLGVTLAAATVIGAVAAPSAMAVPAITMSGSTSVAPLATLLAKGYIKDKRLKGKVKFKLAQGGSDVGVSDVAAGRVSIGMSSRDPRPSDSGVVFNKIAKDAICLVTNPQNTLPNLTQAQVRAIFSGQVRNWEEVAGSTTTGPINLNIRTAASGTQDAFQNIFMGGSGGSRVTETAAARASNGLIQQAVQSDKNAIGYVSADFTRGTHTAAYEGVPCSLNTAKSGEYGGVRTFYMVTRGEARGTTRRFIQWVQLSGRAQKIISTHWVPLG
jgi:phosphate transport system substrate-binding protein